MRIRIHNTDTIPLKLNTKCNLYNKLLLTIVCLLLLLQVVKCSACVVRDWGRETEAHDVLKVRGRRMVGMGSRRHVFHFQHPAHCPVPSVSDPHLLAESD